MGGGIMKRKIIAFLLAFVLIITAMPAAAEPTSDEIIPDVLIARPCGLAMIVLGSALFIVALPVALPSGSVGKVGRKLFLDPVEFTFIRPVGDFDYQLGTWPPKQSEEK